MQIIKQVLEKTTWQQVERWEVQNGQGTAMSKAYFRTIKTRFGHEWLPTLGVGGVGTGVPYRRNGCVRAMFEEAFRLAPQRGWQMAILHTFSFPYYRQFGFERVCDHLVIELPVRTLGHLARPSRAFEPMTTQQQLDDALALFDRFTDMRYISFARHDGARFSYPSGPDTGKRRSFLQYGADGAAHACVNVLYDPERHDVLEVEELIFDSPEALKEALGFLRMFEGEMERIRLLNCALIPEVDAMLSVYEETSYRLVPDIMARVLDTEAVLSAMPYPEQAGRFTLRVEDALPMAGGVFQVAYQDGRAEVRRLGADAPFDVSVKPPAFAQLVYGTHALTPQLLACLRGVELAGDPRDLIRVFPRRICGMFEHF